MQCHETVVYGVCSLETWIRRVLPIWWKSEQLLDALGCFEDELLLRMVSGVMAHEASPTCYFTYRRSLGLDDQSTIPLVNFIPAWTAPCAGIGPFGLAVHGLSTVPRQPHQRHRGCSTFLTSIEIFPHSLRSKPPRGSQPKQPLFRSYSIVCNARHEYVALKQARDHGCRCQRQARPHPRM